MRRLFLAVLAVICSGCTALETRETQAYLVLHAVDTMQTYHAAQQPDCYAEHNPTTTALIGEHPSDAQVIAWSVGYAGVHIAVTDWLLRNDHPKIAKVLQYVQLASTSKAILHNYSIGIRIGSPNHGC